MDILREIYFLRILMISIKGILACLPAEEGKQYAIYAEWTVDEYTNLHVSWRKKDVRVSSCKSFSSCSDYQTENIQTSIEKISENIVSSTLIIKNVAVTDEGIWSLFRVGKSSLENPEIKICHLKIYGRDHVCIHETDDTSIGINCNLSRIYPSSECLATTHKSEIIFGNTTTYVNKLDSRFFDTTCLVQLPKSIFLTFTSGQHNVNVTIYPNLTNTLLDVIYGTNITVNVKQKEELKLMLDNCPAEVIEGEEVTCRCTISTQILILPIWYTDSQSMRKTENNVLKFTAQKGNNESYSCHVSSTDEYTFTPVVYKPNILDNTTAKALTFYVNGVALQQSQVRFFDKELVEIVCLNFQKF
ncbi:hypothetical protein Btru_009289 [Bulinus truncatus]|nr:hypothetical protein Btru_009289 [Bulinus truncatus]